MAGQAFKVFFGFKSRHASKACSCHGLSIDIIGDVSGCEDAWDIGCCGVRRGLEIAARFHVELPFEELGLGSMSDGDENAMDGKGRDLPGRKVS